MKRLVSVILIFFSILNCAKVIFAEDTVTMDIAVDPLKRSVSISGIISSVNGITSIPVYITTRDTQVSDITKGAVSNAVHALAQVAVDNRGFYSHTFTLPETMQTGEYKVVIGGIGENIGYEERSFPFLYSEDGEIDSCIWIEAENYTSVTGGYSVKTDNNASGKSLLALDTPTPGTAHTVNYNFSVRQAGEYDIWILSTTGNQNYVSNFKWRIDGGAYTNFDNTAVSESVYTTSDYRQVPMNWYKLAQKDFEEDTYNLTFLTDEMRAMSPQFYYHSLDLIAVVPSNWNWEPYKLGKAYNSKSVLVDFYDAEIVQSTVMQDGYIDVNVSNILLQEISGDPIVYAQLVWKGYVISTGLAVPSPPMSKRQINQIYSDTIRINVPFDAPNAVCEVRVGVGIAGATPYQNTGERGEAGLVNVGIPASSALPLSARLDSLSIPLELTSGAFIKGEAEITLDRDVDFDTKPYLTLWKGDVLWGISESEVSVETSTWETGVANHFNFKFKVDGRIPSNTYDVKIGLHKIDVSQGHYPLSINGYDESDSLYRPFSHGFYKEKKTGGCHFWYINQNSTLIWDSEPFIPMGGMVCLRYITHYNTSDSEVSRKAHWDIDKEALNTLKANGVKDIYINPVTRGVNIPAHAWQWVFDNLDSMGFTYGTQYGFTTNHHEMDMYYIRANGKVYSKTIKNGGTVTLDISKDEFSSNGTYIPLSGSYIAIRNSDQTAMQSGICTLTETSGNMLRFSANVMSLPLDSYTVYFTPRIKQTPNKVINYWNDGDEILSQLSSFAQDVDFGENFRLFVDLLGNESGFYNELEAIRPSGVSYNKMFEDWLMLKYGSISDLNNAWGSTSALPSFKAAASLIPLYSTIKDSNDVYYTYARDEAAGVLYKFNSRTGVMWLDNLQFKSESYLNFNNKAAEVVKTSADVPVILKNVWGYKDYFVNREQNLGIDGLGVEAYGDYTRLGHLSANTYGMCKQFSKTAWITATETSIEENVQQFYDKGGRGYGSKAYMHGHFDTLMKHGVKGIYDFLFYEGHDIRLRVAYSYINNPAQFDWLS